MSSSVLLVRMILIIKSLPILPDESLKPKAIAGSSRGAHRMLRGEDVGVLSDGLAKATLRFF